MLLLAACRDTVLGAGGTLPAARQAVQDASTAFEVRFTNVVRDPAVAQARVRIARFALAPSRLAEDTSLWTAVRSIQSGTTTYKERELELHGAQEGNRFVFRARPRTPLPTVPGEQRHLIRLDALGNDDWRWLTNVDHAIGSMPPARAGDVFRLWFATAERPAAAVQTDYRTTMPRTVAALGRLMVVDSLITTPRADSSTSVAVHLRFTSDALARQLPALGRFVHRYVEPARYRLRFGRAGLTWFDVRGEEGTTVLRFRSRHGVLLPLAGGDQPMPDSLTLEIDALAHVGLFTVGATHLEGAFTQIRSGSERGWAMRFTKEPEWHLPLIGERLLRTPLRRPFAGEGVVFRIGLRRGPDGQTLLARTLDLTVRESAVMRFLGRLGFTAMSDYAGRVEEEENRFLAEVMRAVREDVGL